MAFLNKKKNTKVEVAKVVVAKKEGTLPRDYSFVIKRPRVTEKATLHAQSHNAYTFEIADKATKHDVKKAVEMLYKVKPVSINITRLPAKIVTIRGKEGRVSGVKKASVFLKKGDTINFV